MDTFTTVLVVAVTVVLTALLALLFWAGNRLQGLLSRQRWSFSARYPPALAEKHRWLAPDLDDRTGLPPLRLRQVYATLRDVAAGGDGPRLAWSEIFQPGDRRLVILGGPGAGKSTFLDYLVLIFTDPTHPFRFRFRLRQPFPLFARLRELGSEGAGSLPALLARSVPLKRVPAGFPASHLRKSAVRWTSSTGVSCLVLLDGLDEVPEDKRSWAVEEIEKLAREYPHNHYVITCRTTGWHNQLPGFRAYEIQPFNRDEARRFIGGWYSELLRALTIDPLGARPSPDRLQAAESEALARAAVETGDLGQILETRADLLQAARTPLLLSSLVLMHHRKERLDLPELQQATAPPMHVLPSLSEILHLAGPGPDLSARIQALQTLSSLKVQLDGEIRQVLEKARQDKEPALRNAAAWAWCALGAADELGLVEVPAGEFLMGSFEGDEQPPHLLYLPTFYIGRNLITVGDFSEFLAVSGHQLEKKESRFRKRNVHRDHPVVEVGWADAMEYARWHGMSLPSEAEWEKAARGVDGRRYPWGNEWKPGHANTLESWPSRRKATITSIGSFSPQGDSPYGCRDMAGNVWEWIRGSLEPYPYDPADGREAPGRLSFPAVRGGAADEDSGQARCAKRSVNDFRTPYGLIGFRVVLKPFSADFQAK